MTHADLSYYSMAILCSINWISTTWFIIAYSERVVITTRGTTSRWGFLPLLEIENKLTIIQDLSQVGRDLKETIIIDNSPTSYIFHPEHAIPISSWFSDAHDNELLDLIPVLEDLAGAQVQDVSMVLDCTL